jgi:uncharacterized protein (TIGR02145 family)
MKKITIAIAFICTCLVIHAQTPSSFKYQALARTATGEIMANEAVEFTISILESSVTGTSVYSETHSVSTNQFGLVSFNIGEGANPTSTFGDVDWTTGILFVEIKLNGNLIGTSQLLSVPFAKYADKAGNIFSGDFNDLTNQPDLGLKLDTTATTNWDKDVSDDFSGNYKDLTNQPDLDYYIQNLMVSFIGDTLHLSNSNYVIIPGISASNINKQWQPGDVWFDSRDSSAYKTVKIGEQVWMAENLNYGIMISGVSDQTDNAIYEKYCYDNSENNCDNYGALYQWDEAMQYSTVESVQGVCPSGWHIPSQSEWVVLRDFLGGYSIAGGKLKDNTEYYWNLPNTGATNESGFNGLPSGDMRDAVFSGMRQNGYFWSTSDFNPSEIWTYYLSYDNSVLDNGQHNKNNGKSIRCIKDTE